MPPCLLVNRQLQAYDLPEEPKQVGSPYPFRVHLDVEPRDVRTDDTYFGDVFQNPGGRMARTSHFLSRRKRLSAFIVIVLLTTVIIAVLWNVFRPSLSLVTHRALPFQNTLLAPYIQGFPRVEVTRNPLSYNRYDQLCWLTVEGKLSGTWMNLSGGAFVTLSANGQYVAAITSNGTISVAKQHQPIQLVPNVQPFSLPRGFYPYPAIASNGTLYGFVHENFNVSTRRSVPVPDGWELPPYTHTPMLSAQPDYYLLHKQRTGGNAGVIYSTYGLYNSTRRQFIWRYALKVGGVGAGTVGATFLSHDRSVLVITDEAAVFQASTYLGSYCASTRARINTPLTPDEGRWYYSEDGTIWTEDGRNIYILNWRHGTPSITTLPLFSTASALQSTATLTAVWGDGRLIAHVRPERIVKEKRGTPNHTDIGNTPLETARNIFKRMGQPAGVVYRTLTLYVDGKARDTFTKKVSNEQAIDMMLNSPDAYTGYEMLAFSTDGKYLAWKSYTQSDTNTTYDFYMFRVKGVSSAAE